MGFLENLPLGGGGASGVQETATIGGVNLAKKLENKPLDSGKDILGRLGETALSSALSFGILGIPGTASSVYNAKNTNVTSNTNDISNNSETPSEIKTAIKTAQAGTADMQHDNYIRQINDVMTGKTPTDKTVIIGETPEILRRFGANPHQLTLNQSNIRKIAYPEGYMGGKHNLGFYALEQLPKQLANPVAILKSSTQPNSIIIFTEFLDTQNNPVMVPIHLDKLGNIGISNEVASMYGRGNFDNFINTQRENGNILYEDKNRSLQQLPLSGLQLSGLVSSADPIFNSSIPQGTPGVNNYDMQNGGEYAGEVPDDKAFLLANQPKPQVLPGNAPILTGIPANDIINSRGENYGERFGILESSRTSDNFAGNTETTQNNPFQGGSETSIPSNVQGNGRTLGEFSNGTRILETSDGEHVLNSINRIIRSMKEAGNDYSAFVTPHTAEDYSKARTYQTEDGLSTVTVHDGDVVSLISAVKGRGKDLLLTAIKNGGNKLDNYGSKKLSETYQDAGFIPVARVKFNPEFAPPDWNYQRDGTPDILVMLRLGERDVI